MLNIDRSFRLIKFDYPSNDFLLWVGDSPSRLWCHLGGRHQNERAEVLPSELIGVFFFFGIIFNFSKNIKIFRKIIMNIFF